MLHVAHYSTNAIVLLTIGLITDIFEAEQEGDLRKTGFSKDGKQ